MDKLQILGLLALLLGTGSIAFLVIRAALTLRQSRVVLEMVGRVYEAERQVRDLQAAVMQLQKQIHEDSNNTKKMFIWACEVDRWMKKQK